MNRTAAAGLSLSPNCPRADLVRAAAWTAAALEGAGEEVRLEIL